MNFAPLHEMCRKLIFAVVEAILILLQDTFTDVGFIVIYRPFEKNVRNFFILTEMKWQKGGAGGGL
jgi:hypothetical protein